MKRTKVMTVIIVAVMACLAGAAQAAGNEYVLYGDVYNADGSAGTNMTENSYGGLRAYRKGFAGQVAPQVNNIFSLNCTQKIFDADGVFAAYFLSDVGSSYWSPKPVVGETIITVVQVYQQQFTLCPWTGNSYAAAIKSVVDDANTYNSRSNMPDIRLQEIPAPQVSSIGASDVSLTWTGIAYDPDDLIKGYTIYRSTEPGGAGGFGEIGTAGQVKGGAVTYNDSGLSVLYTYYYQLAVNFEWGGGGGAPLYYVTDARSSLSAAVYTANSPTPTETPSVELSNTDTPTATPSVTYSFTDTATITPSSTPTNTTTASETITPSLTVTPSFTVTLTLTITLTCSSTPTCTVTQVSELAANLMNEQLVIFNSPIKNGRLQLGVFSDGSGIAVIQVYNIAGELVLKEKLPVLAGVNLINEKFEKARGLYILRVTIYTPAETVKLPVRKFAVVKNN